MTLGDISIAVSKTVKSLGVTLDETLSFNSHVDNVCKAAHFNIRALRHIRRCIDDDTARTVACSMVGARLDYCNSILHGTSAGNLGRIQRVINTLGRVVSGARKRDHITPVLADLHWLPIASRIRFKVALQSTDIQNSHHEETGVSRRSTQFSDCIEITPVKLNEPSSC